MKEFFVKRYKKLKPNFSIEACQVDRAIRINVLKCNPHEMLARLKKEGVKLEKIDGLDFGYRYSASFSLGSTPEYLQGFYYLQETASQFAAKTLNPLPGDHVLDMCAAPGSKTTHLAQLMKNEGVIVALDNKTWRLSALRNNLERCGVTNTIVYNKDARYVRDFKQQFDKILLDAPCSGNFLLDDDWFEKRTLEDIKTNSTVQRQLVQAGFDVLKTNGTLVYSTCSLEPEEDEEVIEWAKQELGCKVISQKRFWPDVTHTQGFFIAVLQKK